MVLKMVAPSSLRFTQDSISGSFGDHPGQSHDTETIEGTFRDLLYGDITVNSIRNIGVVQKDGQMWVVSGNRRLYVFQKLEEYGRIHQIPVNVVPLNLERFQKMLTTKNNGRSVYIRQDRKRAVKMADSLRKIYSQWVQHGRPTDGYPTTAYAMDRSTYPGRPSSSIHASASPPEPRLSAGRTPPSSTRRVYADWGYDYDYYDRTPAPAASTPPPPRTDNNRDDSWCVIL